MGLELKSQWGISWHKTLISGCAKNLLSVTKAQATCVYNKFKRTRNAKWNKTFHIRNTSSNCAMCRHEEVAKFDLRWYLILRQTRHTKLRLLFRRCYVYIGRRMRPHVWNHQRTEKVRIYWKPEWKILHTASRHGRQSKETTILKLTLMVWHRECWWYLIPAKLYRPYFPRTSDKHVLNTARIGTNSETTTHCPATQKPEARTCFRTGV